MEDIVQMQRATVAEHIRAENAKEWPAVYDTFLQNETAYFDTKQYAKQTKGNPVVLVWTV